MILLNMLISPLSLIGKGLILINVVSLIVQVAKKLTKVKVT